jgi:hypothetical protein
VAAGYDEADVGRDIGAIHEGGKEVAFEVVDADERFTGDAGHGLGGGAADEERRCEAGAHGGSEDVDFRDAEPGGLEGFFDEGV